MANNANAPSSVLPPPSSSCTVVCAADVVAITQQGMVWATCQGTIVHAVTAFCHRDLLDTPRNAKQCQGTFVCTATTLVSRPLFARLPSLPPQKRARNGQQCKGTVVRSAAVCWQCRHCHYRVSGQGTAGQGTIFLLPWVSLCTVICAAHQVVERSSHQAINPLNRQFVEPSSHQAPSSLHPSVQPLSR
jgi:hypothetical protein